MVEDKPMVAEVVERYLKRDGHSVSIALDGPAALQSIEDLRPDLLVLDVMLPGSMASRSAAGCGHAATRPSSS